MPDNQHEINEITRLADVIGTVTYNLNAVHTELKNIRTSQIALILAATGEEPTPESIEMLTTRFDRIHQIIKTLSSLPKK